MTDGEELQRYADKLFTECINECKAADIPLCAVQPHIKISSVTSVFGYLVTETGQIFISRVTFELSEYVIKNVFIHELIHCVPGADNHGKIFKHWARVMNKRGWNIEPRSDLKQLVELSGKRMEDVALPGTVFLVCRDCENYILRKENSKMVKQTGKYHCNKCGGELDTVSVDENGNRRNVSNEQADILMKSIMCGG